MSFAVAFCVIHAYESVTSSEKSMFLSIGEFNRRNFDLQTFKLL